MVSTWEGGMMRVHDHVEASLHSGHLWRERLIPVEDEISWASDVRVEEWGVG